MGLDEAQYERMLARAWRGVYDALECAEGQSRRYHRRRLAYAASIISSIQADILATQDATFTGQMRAVNRPPAGSVERVSDR